ncbi:hypothetical protein F2Q68_00040622 [Brassica cretica]|uniref:Uncharacterized protein n=1 Tax=Brassica cretica TaxID=69181 RepID=A0A8S9ME91_BRACR|nr:hypothetical protein F2Q68_00040622 [Brassica cretica]
MLIGRKCFEVKELVLRKKETPEAAKPTEGGSSNSVGGSIQSSLRKTKSHEKKTSEEDRSAGFSSRNLTVSPTVFQRLGSSPHSSELEERRSSVFARQGDLSTPLEIVISRESSQQKRRRISPQDDRRFSSSDEQTSKKQRKGPISERLEAPSVFHRLGGISSSSGAHSEGKWKRQRQSSHGGRKRKKLQLWIAEHQETPQGPQKEEHQEFLPIDLEVLLRRATRHKNLSGGRRRLLKLLKQQKAAVPTVWGTLFNPPSERRNLMRKMLLRKTRLFLQEFDCFTNGFPKIRLLTSLERTRYWK